MKHILLIILMLSFVACNCPKIVIDKSIEENINSEEYQIKSFKIQEKKYSLLMFTTGLDGEKIKVINCKNELFNDSLKTNSIQPFAKYLKIDNTCNTKIYDKEKKYFFQVKSKLAVKYKFIYIRKDYSNRYIITYTNKHKRIL